MPKTKDLSKDYERLLAAVTLLNAKVDALTKELSGHKKIGDGCPHKL